MRVEKDGKPITCLEDWHRLAPPKGSDQWVEGRSAYEIAKAWCGPTGAAVPECLRALSETSDRTQGLEVELVIPEHRIRFDEQGGEPRNADVAFVGRVAGSRVAVTVAGTLADYRAFLDRLGAAEPEAARQGLLVGPLMIPGVPLFQSAPQLLIGKVTTNCRGLDA